MKVKGEQVGKEERRLVQLLKVMELLVVAFMGLATCLVGLILVLQERVLHYEIGGYVITHPYWEVGFVLIVIGMTVFIVAIVMIMFRRIETKLKRGARALFGIMFSLLLISMLTLAFNIQPVKAEPKTIIVPDDYPTIQGAINAASPGYTIYVRAGTYYEHLVVNKSVSLIGEEGATIHGNSSGRMVVRLTADDISIQGFTITKSGAGWRPIYTSGIYAYKCNNITVKYNTVTWNLVGVFLHSSNNSVISGNEVTRNAQGSIWIYYSSNNTISGNIMEKNYAGLTVGWSSNNTIIGNNMTANHYGGMSFWASTGNMVRNNTMWGNKQNFHVSGKQLSHFMHDIDASNLVNDKPIYYLINQENMLVDPTNFPEAGYLALVNCTNVTVKNLKLNESMQMAYTKNAKITRNYIVKTSWGIDLFNSSGNLISENNLTKNMYGVSLSNSSNNYVIRNEVTQNMVGIGLSYSSNNTISGNNIVLNDWSGVKLEHSSNNRIFHNNFVNNSFQVRLRGQSVNTWNDGYPSGGNYWSDYTGVDSYGGPGQNETGSDGIGDTPYVIDENDVDHYPLMKPYVPLLGDINDDRTVDISDVAIAAMAFGSYPGHPRWSPIADINFDNIIDIHDICAVARNFGKTL